MTLAAAVPALALVQMRYSSASELHLTRGRGRR
jgi:hypothetical protein